MSEPRRRFPSSAPGRAIALGDEPVLIDGMKVLFDTKVALFPVTLDPPKPGADRNGTRRPSAEPRRRAI